MPVAAASARNAVPAARRAALLRALAWLGLAPDAVALLPVRAGALAAPPPRLSAYLVFGEARALGGDLPAAAQAAATIELVDAPADLLAAPARKRALWRALKTLRRALRKSG